MFPCNVFYHFNMAATCQARSQRAFVRGHWSVGWAWYPNIFYNFVMTGKGLRAYSNAPRLKKLIGGGRLQNCKNIDYNSGGLASFRSQCYRNHFYTNLTKFFAKRFEHSPYNKLPRHIFKHSYSEHKGVEMRVVSIKQYRRSRDSLHEHNYQN